MTHLFSSSGTVSYIVIFTVFLSFPRNQVRADCVWYDQCGDDPDFNDGLHGLNCVYNGPAIKVRHRKV